jgi:uncharacterized membrane protein YfcA
VAPTSPTPPSPGGAAAASTSNTRKSRGDLAARKSALTTTVGINGPPLVTCLSAREATLTQLRDTLAVIFLALNLVAIPILAARGGTIPALLLPALAAGLVVGHILGLQAHTRLPTHTLDRALVTILAAAGGASIIAGSTALV